LATAPKYTGITSFVRWIWVAYSKEWGLKAAIPYWPTPPTAEEVKRHFIEDGKLDEALGAFVRKMLEGGYTVTILGYNVEVNIELLRKFTIYPFNYCVWRTWVTLTVDFTTTPEISIKAIPAIFWVIVALGIAISMIITSVGVFFALQNLTTHKTTYEKYAWVHSPTCQYEWRVVESGSEQGPPDWWSYVLIPVGVTVALGATLIIYEMVKGFRRKE